MQHYHLDGLDRVRDLSPELVDHQVKLLQGKLGQLHLQLLLLILFKSEGEGKFCFDDIIYMN